MESQKTTIDINLKVIIQTLWNHKIKITVISFVFLAIGILYAFTAKEEFTSEGKILPEISGGSGNNLGSLANLVGIGGFELGLKNSTEAIRPDLYPDILNTTPFFLSLLQKDIINKNGVKEKFEEFYHRVVEENKKIDPELLSKPKVKPERVIIIDRLTEKRILNLKSRINAQIDKKTGVISISVKMPDPVVAADIASFSIDYMTSYITNYRTDKLRKEVDFLAEKVAASKGKYYKTQELKASYTDQFQSPTIRLQSADIKRERLESDYKISASFYNELSKKYEEAKIKLQQETPVFQIAQLPIVPNYKSEPKKLIIIAFSLIIGFSISVVFVLITSTAKWIK